MSCHLDYRDSLDAATALGAGPAGSVEQEAADLPLQTGNHLTPLTAPHDSRWEGERQEGNLNVTHLDSLQMSTFCGTNN